MGSTMNRVFHNGLWLFVVLVISVSVNGIQSRELESSHLPEKHEKCSVIPSHAIVDVSLPGQPFGIVPTEDNCWVFVALTNLGQVAVLRHEEGTLHLYRTIPAGFPARMVITHDSKLLIVANSGSDSVTLLDVERMLTGQGNPFLGEIHEGGIGAINVNVTADDRLLFVSDEGSDTITVINLQEARQSRFTSNTIIGKIPVGRAPIALVFSPDQRFLYTTSEIAQADFGFPIECRPEGEPNAPPINQAGTVLVVDVARAERDPPNSIVAHAPAGCSPVRLALSADGERAYITARGSNALLVFNAVKLVHDPSHSLIAKVPVGLAPVGVATVHEDEIVVVANSNRFSSGDQPQNLSVIRAARVTSGAGAVLGTIPAGVFPREVELSPDGRTLYVGNFVSRTLELIDAQRLPVDHLPKAKE